MLKKAYGAEAVPYPDADGARRAMKKAQMFVDTVIQAGEKDSSRGRILHRAGRGCIRHLFRLTATR
jgi:hypothetical protein